MAPTKTLSPLIDLCVLSQKVPGEKVFPGIERRSQIKQTVTGVGIHSDTLCANVPFPYNPPGKAPQNGFQSSEPIFRRFPANTSLHRKMHSNCIRKTEIHAFKRFSLPACRAH
ncbi:hypothetical protein AB3X94_12420 [Paraburkholderia sp. BR10923]|uniref:hypothetical protein n=1 Tax=Paraburkholderia sp. BR10923 TaxID=3236992 RepID=UPI0034CE2801